MGATPSKIQVQIAFPRKFSLFSKVGQCLKVIDITAYPSKYTCKHSLFGRTCLNHRPTLYFILDIFDHNVCFTFKKLFERTKSKKYIATFVSWIHQTCLKLKNIACFFLTKKINANKNAFEVAKFLIDTVTLRPTTIFATFSKPHIYENIIKDSIKG